MGFGDCRELVVALKEQSSATMLSPKQPLTQTGSLTWRRWLLLEADPHIQDDSFQVLGGAFRCQGWGFCSFFEALPQAKDCMARSILVRQLSAEPMASRVFHTDLACCAPGEPVYLGLKSAGIAQCFAG